MTGTDAAPVHRCAFHTGRAQAGAVTAELCRRALAAGSPVVAHVDDGVRALLPARVAGAVAFAPQEALVETPLAALADAWADHLGRAPAGVVTVVCQQPFSLAPDLGHWRTAEETTTALVAERPLAVTCLVDTEEGPPERLALARGVHPVLWVDGTDVPNPDLRLRAGPPRTGGVLVADRLLDPRAAAENRRWWHACLTAAGLDRTRREELVLVLHEAVGTVAALDGGPGGLRVRITRDGAEVACEVHARGGCPLLPPHAVPDDRRLLMLWLAEKVSPAVSLAVLPSGTGSRIVVRALDPDRA
ncbi:hypothetical protein SAMN05660657_01241 [Geodermatophilus amargosae]|uniref:MEDS: MEthanogen/methylotroph, DcmR Sensory domain n=1 Tax=Geodermatophilus amargosae TaxID=1296565 RepID=A0A1I6YMC6_9ACTN|nr:hypothetical protein [Geodermatophilus amargosae]SFT51620.1 hypothetical protein SAMN05660657_01241 [Geodermatophilus amargosae]